LAAFVTVELTVLTIPRLGGGAATLGTLGAGDGGGGGGGDGCGCGTVLIDEILGRLY
jgi:hypothetical protein